MRIKPKKMAVALLTFVGFAQLSGCAAVIGLGALGVTSSAYDRRSLGHQIDDKTIEWKLKSKLAQADDISEDTRVRVFSYNAQILLVGQAKDKKQRRTINEITASLPMVAKVFNELRIGPPIGIKQRSEDTWITSQIKGQLLTKTKINPLSIRIVTENSEVFIVGKLSDAETQTAIDIARHTSGVKTVFHLVERVESNT